MTVAENYILDSYHREPYSTHGSLEPRGDRRWRGRACRTSTSARRRSRRCASSLSGGNQQKVVVAREFSRAAQAGHRVPADARPRRRLDRVHPQADRRPARRRARRSSSSAPSSTRCSPSATGSRSCSGDGSWGSSRAPRRPEKRRDADGRRASERAVPRTLIRPASSRSWRSCPAFLVGVPVHVHHGLREPSKLATDPVGRHRRRSATSATPTAR